MRRVLFVLAAAGMFAATASAQNPSATGASRTPTIWDHLGIHQIRECVHGCAQRVSRTLGSTAVFDYAANSVAAPILEISGLKPGSAPTSFGPPPAAAGASAPAPAGPPASGGPPPSAGAPAASGSAAGGAADGAGGAAGGAGGAAGGGDSAADAAAAAAEEATAAAIEAATASASDVATALVPLVDPANVLVKVKAIRFLATQDCICYPEVLDALLGSLDDCSEVVRYEALLALRTGCARGGSCAACGVHRLPGDSGANGYACQCQVKVIKRLSDLLLERNIRGYLKERSERVRRLAGLMIVECVNSTPVAARSAMPGLEAQPDPPLPAAPR